MSQNPRTTVNIQSADTGIKLNAQKILVLGQKLSSGTATSGTLQSDIITQTQINNLFGRKSHIAKEIRAILKNLSISRVKPQVDAIALADNGTTKAIGTFTFTGTATENGTIVFYIDSKINGKYTVSVVSGDTPTVIAGKLVALVSADTNANYTATNLAGVVTITAANAGTNGNQIRLGFENTVAGVTVVKSGNYLAGGTTNPVLTDLFDAIDGIQYQTIVYPSSWDLATLYNFTEPRFNIDNDILYSHGFTFKVDTYSNLNTLLDGLNYKTLTIGFDKVDGGVFENPDVINAQFCAYRALQLTEGANVGSLYEVQTTGGIRYASIPYFNIPFVNLPVIPQGETFAKEEVQELINSGGYTFQNNKSNTMLLLAEVRTTYKTNTLGDSDPTFKYLNYVDTLTIAREYFFNGYKQTYPRHTMTTAEQAPSNLRAFVTKNEFIATSVQFYNELVNFGLFRGGKDVEFAQRMLDTIDFDILNGKISSQVIAPITTQLREIFIDFIADFN